MKQILLTLCLLLAFGTTKAQNDATWEETIAFISKNSHFLYNNESFDNEDKLLDFTVKNGILKFKVDYPSTIWPHYAENEVDLNKLKTITKVENYIFLKFSGNYWKTFVKHPKQPDEDAEYSFEQRFICVSDSEMLDRMYNAFTHLAKLATEKREAQRKASGDKF